MLFHRQFHLAKNTFLGEIQAEISSCVTSPASKRGKELVSLLHGTFKNKISSVLFLLYNHILPWICLLVRDIYILSFVITLSISQIHEWIEQNNRKAANLYLLPNISLSPSHMLSFTWTLSLLLSLMLCSPFLSGVFSFIRRCWDFFLILLVTVCTERGRH